MFVGREREQERLDTTNVRILSDAQPPQDRRWPPRRLLLVLAGLLAGCLGGAGLAYLLELMREQSPAVIQSAGQPARKIA